MGSEPADEEDALIDDYLERRQRALMGMSPPSRAGIDRKEAARRRETLWTLALLALLLVSAYVFWVLPHQLGSRPVQVRFEKEP